jgi:hypothetical protein
MAATTGTPPGSPGGPPGKGTGGKGIGAWVKKNPGMAAAAGIGLALGAFVLIKKGSSASSATTPADTSTVGTVDPSLYGTPSDLAGTDGSLGSTDDASTIEAQLNTLQGSLAAITAATAPPQASGGATGSSGGTPAPTAPGSGGSYSPKQPHKLTGPQYQYLKAHGKGAYGAAGGRYTGAKGWAWLTSHPLKPVKK